MSKIASGFARLDVKEGRTDLLKRLKDGERRIPISISGFVTDQWSVDDGTSAEFSIDVASVDLAPSTGILKTMSDAVAEERARTAAAEAERDALNVKLEIAKEALTIAEELNQIGLLSAPPGLNERANDSRRDALAKMK